MKFFQMFAGLAAVAVLTGASVLAQDPGWPRKLAKSGGTMIVYQPQADSWIDYTKISFGNTHAGKNSSGDMYAGQTCSNTSKATTRSTLRQL